MEIKRYFCNQPVLIELTDDEIRKAHEEYCINYYVCDVELFIKVDLNIYEDISRYHLKEMAALFYDEKFDYPNIYAMARAVIPYLKKILGIDCDYTVEDFIDADLDLECI